LPDASDRPDLARVVPKAEIHLHLEGSLDLETLIAIRGSRGEPTDREARRRLAALYHHRDFPHFLRNFRAICEEIRSPRDFSRLTEALSDHLRSDRVRYAEVMLSPLIFTRAGLPLDEIMQAIHAAARRGAAEGGPRLRFLFDGVRQHGVGALEELVEAAAACRGFEVIGIGMGGDERASPAQEFAAVYREARRLGLRTTVHAGEFDGSRSVWEAVEVLEVERIGHGVRAAEDAVLLGALRRYGVPLECCPTSNLRTGVVRSWEEHPIRALHAAGCWVTVNSDDPALFATTLGEEWRALETRLGFGPREALAIGINTVRASFLDDEGKRVLIDEMTRAAEDAGCLA